MTKLVKKHISFDLRKSHKTSLTRLFVRFQLKQTFGGKKSVKQKSHISFVQDFTRDVLNQIFKTDFVVILALDFKEVRCAFQNRKLLNQMLQLPLK